MQKILVGDSNVLELVRLRDTVSGSLLVGATVQATLKTTAGVNVTGMTWPVTLAEIEPGRYRAILSPSLVVVAGTQYTAHVTATKAGVSRTFDEPLLAVNQ